MSVKKVVWQVASRPSGTQVEDGSEPDVQFWVDATSGCVRYVETLPSDLPVQKIRWKQLLQIAIHSNLPGCSQQTPTEIQVDDKQALVCLKAVAAPLGVKVVFKKRLTLLDEIYESLYNLLQGNSDFSYLQGSQLQPEDVSELAEDMLHFMQARPFAIFNGDDILEVVGHSRSPVFCSVLGMGGMEYGLGIYLTRDAAEAYQAGIDEEMMASQPALSLTLVSEEDCPPTLAFEVGQHRWPCHPLGFPLLMRVDGERAQPTEAELYLARDLLRLVVRYAAKPGAGSYTINGRKLKIRPLSQRQAASQLKSLIYSQLLLDLPEPGPSKQRSLP